VVRTTEKRAQGFLFSCIRVNRGRIDRHHFEDVVRDKTLEWLESRDASEPFLAVMSTHAPHSPATPARRHRNLFSSADLPRGESFNEKQVSDKNGWIRQMPRLSRDEIDEMEILYRNRLRVMEGVDEMLRAVLLELESQGELDNTYVFLTSDHGFHFGERNLRQREYPLRYVLVLTVYKS
jgi:N-acetylglucosamine-6-sulfatase